MRALTLVLLAVTVVLTGCGGSSGNSASSGGNAAGLPRKVTEGGAPPNAPPGAPKAENVRLAPAAIVYTADLTVRTGNVAQATAQAKQIVAAAGGYVSNESDTDAPGSHPSATITFKVPSAKYPGVLGQLASSRVGRQESLRQQADDVTQEVADVNSRVTSAQATLASFRDLLGRAKSVSEVIRVEQEIADRESDLESLQARQKALSAQTTNATITLRLEGTTTTAHPEHHRSGFAGGLATGWDAFTTFLSGLALVLGWLLPFLGLAALIGLPSIWLWRRFRTARS
jgi:hypothetical protein